MHEIGSLLKEQDTAVQVVDKMLANDAFSQWLGIEIVEIGVGRVIIQMRVRPEMMNGFQMCHGGVTFAFADSALAFACNSHGRLSVLLTATMSFPAAVKEGDTLTAVAVEESVSNRVGVYSITVTNDNDEKVGVFQGTVYRTKKSFLSL